MNKKVWMAFLIFFIVAFVFSAGMLVRQELEYREAEKQNDEAQSLFEFPDLSTIDFGNINDIDDTDESTEPDDPNTDETDDQLSPPETDGNETVDPGDVTDAPPETTAPPKQEEDPYQKALSTANLAAVQKVNSDVKGWIYVTDTKISYPIIYYKDNDYYLRRSWKKKSSVAGTIFMECKCSPDFSNFNTIIYGHRMNNGTMFGDLKYYKTKSYWKAHPNVYIVTNDGVSVYNIYAAYEVSTSGETFKISFSNDEAKREYIDFTLKNSVINTGIIPTVNDHIITLSTCPTKGYETRWIVQAVKRG